MPHPNIVDLLLEMLLGVIFVLLVVVLVEANLGLIYAGAT